MKPDAQPGHPVPGMSIWGWNDYVRFEAKFERRGPDECWLWTAHISAAGYGKFWLGGRKRSAHAAAWLLYRGRIPDGFVVDHVAARGCTNLHCVNPSHLEPVEQS